MHILLFIIYSFALGYGVLRMPFFRNSGIRPGWLLLFFALHVTVGCLHNIIAYRYYPGHGDIWDFFGRSFLTRHRLTSDFRMFLFENSNWNYITHNGMILVNVALNFLSFDNLYINTLLFSFPVFLGNIALFRAFRKQFPGDSLTALSVLLLPSTLFWTSCVHREGAVYSLLGFLFYYGDRFLSAQNARPFSSSLPGGRVHPLSSRRPALYSFFFFIGIIYFRPAVAISLFPALVIWTWARQTNSFQSPPLFRMASIPSGHKMNIFRKWWFNDGPTTIALVLFLGFGSWTLSRIPAVLSARQVEYQAMEGGSRLYLPLLEPSWIGIAHVLPSALRNGLFEPLPGSGGKAIYTAFSLELIIIWAIMIVALLLLSRNLLIRSQLLHNDHLINSQMLEPTVPIPRSLFSPFAVACLTYSLLGMLLVGMIIPFAGAIVRYRSIFLPFLLAPFLHYLCSTTMIKRLNRSLSLYIFSGPA